LSRKFIRKNIRYRLSYGKTFTNSKLEYLKGRDNFKTISCLREADDGGKGIWDCGEKGIFTGGGAAAIFP